MKRQQDCSVSKAKFDNSLRATNLRRARDDSLITSFLDLNTLETSYRVFRPYKRERTH
jgi:hypothetical protein